MDADRGFGEAKRLLEHHFGDKFKITNAYMEKALIWNNIPIDNGEALHSYALFLHGCCNVMRTLRNMDELNLPSNMRLLISKVPYKIKEKWRSHAFDIKERTGVWAKSLVILFIFWKGRPGFCKTPYMVTSEMPPQAKGHQKQPSAVASPLQVLYRRAKGAVLLQQWQQCQMAMQNVLLQGTRCNF